MMKLAKELTTAKSFVNDSESEDEAVLFEDSHQDIPVIVTPVMLNEDSNLKRAVYLDISKAFDRVWHDGLLYKLKSYGINGPLLNLLKRFLTNRFQKVALNGQTSNWKEILAGVPQGSILGPLFFLIFLNDTPDEIQSNIFFLLMIHQYSQL